MISEIPEGAENRTVGPDAAQQASPVHIGAVFVRAEARDVAAFRAAIPASPLDSREDELPFTFPMRWLTAPAIRAAVLHLLGDDGRLLPMHEGQTFNYISPLRPDVTYRMDVNLHRADEADQLVLQAHVGPDADHVHLRMEMVLRIITLEPGRSAHI